MNATEHAARLAGPADREARPRIVAVTSGKGGVGKTTVVANLAIALSRIGVRTTVLDGDLGLANLDVVLGVTPGRTIEHFFRGEASLRDIAVEGPHAVRVIPAGSGLPELTDLPKSELARFVGGLQELAASTDLLLLDSAAGIGEQTVRLSGLADRVLLVTWPDPSALIDAYATLKVLAQRRPEQPIELVVNGARDEEEARRIHARLAAACERFLARQIDLLGHLSLDESVRDATREQVPFLLTSPLGRASRDLERLALRISAHGAAVGSGATDATWQGTGRTMDIQH
jgi:flagellar biosynthesis protein FlhG